MATGTKTGRVNPAQLQQMLAAAVQHQAAGRLGDAAALCKNVLSVAPKHPAALHILGLIEHRAGRSQAGAALIAKAVAINPSDVAAQNNLGLVLLHLDNVDEARNRFDKALTLNPDYAEAINNLGTVCTRQGDHTTAEQHFRRALEKKPAYPEALNNLGNVLVEQDSFEDATLQYKAALKLRPDYADAMANMGNALTHLGKADEAVDICRAALAINPRLAKALINLGNALQEQGLHGDAEGAFQQATEVDSMNILAFLNLGQVAQARERFPTAVAAYEKAIEIDPKSSTLSRLAHSLIGAHRSEDAETLLRNALKDRPGDAELLTALGVALTDLSKIEDGLAAFRDAIRVDPGLSEAHSYLGTALAEAGQVDDAVISFRQAIRANADNAMAHHFLALVQKFKSHDDDVKLLEAADARTDLNDAQRMLIDFGLAKIYDDLGKTDLAFKHVARGNALRRQSHAFSMEDETRSFERVHRVFNQAYMDRFAGAGVAGESLIFIVGMPRSGTTLVEQILASHPMVHGAGELMDLAISIHKTMAIAKEDQFEKTFSDATAEDFATTGQTYLDTVQNKLPDARVITDKMPANFLYAGLIPLILPGAKIVHCRRDPVATCFSIFMRIFSTGQHFGYDLRELGCYYRLYRDLMKHWHSVMPGQLLDIHYESLVDSPESEIRRLLDHCGLEWSESCLDFHTTKRTVKTASVTQVRKPIYTESVQAWRRYEHHLQPLLEALGDAIDPTDRETS